LSAVETTAPPDAPSGDTWVGTVDGPLPVGAVTDWAVRPDCGGLVVFCGTARDHSEGRPGVHALEYEAYEDHVVTRFHAVVDEARARWRTAGRVAILHRVGAVPIGEAAVVVAVGAPHRDEAFAAARFCIDTLKQTAPIWKREEWDGGSSWGLDAQPVAEVAAAGADGPRP
jgi:molybdopterin synthase catalytic subunit